MERADLLSVNGSIFGRKERRSQRPPPATSGSSSRNPCNTNCYIARMNAPEVPAERWFAMTRLDENRARTQLAKKAKVPVSAISNIACGGTTRPPSTRTRITPASPDSPSPRSSPTTAG